MPETITVTYTVTLEDDVEKTAAQKEAIVYPNIKDQAAALRLMFDTGITLEGTIDGSVSGQEDL